MKDLGSDPSGVLVIGTFSQAGIVYSMRVSGTLHKQIRDSENEEPSYSSQSNDNLPDVDVSAKAPKRDGVDYEAPRTSFHACTD